jgi:arylsulfatase A-like enzyme
MIYNKKLFHEKIEHEGITRHIDITPTILNLLNINLQPEHEGIPIFSSKREQLALIHTFWKDDIMAVRDGKWKYIKNFSNGFEELFDISTDPSEKNNIAADNKIIAKRYADFINSAIIYKKEFYRRILSK